MNNIELRVGNFVNTPRADQNPFRVDWFDEHKVYQNNGTCAMEFNGEVYDMPHHPLTWDLKDIQPIELTPEILERAGFETPEKYNDSVKYNNGVMIDLHMGKYLLRENNRIELKYLHQLQNLYFALTHQELNINL